MAKARSKSFVANALRQRAKKIQAKFEYISKTKINVESKGFEIDLGDLDRLSDAADKYPDAATKAFRKSLMIIANDLAATLEENMSLPVWDFNKKKGDIIDTGDLRESGNVEIDGTDLVISYDQEYAAIVHFGGYVTSGFNPDIQIYYPGRPWIEATLTGNGPVPAFNFQKALEENFTKFMIDELLKDIS